MMPISDPCDRFYYPHHTPMKDTYFIAYLKLCTISRDRRKSQEFVTFRGRGMRRPYGEYSICLVIRVWGFSPSSRTLSQDLSDKEDDMIFVNLYHYPLKEG